MNTRDEWLKIAVQHEKKACPNCHKHNFKKMYVCNQETRIGYMLFWCESCMHGIYVSRVKAPMNEDIFLITDSKTVTLNTPDIQFIN